LHVRIRIGVCRHGVVLTATNYYKVGERFGFAHFMLANDLMPRHVQVLHLDVGCKFGPWLNRVNDSITQSTDIAITESPAYANSTGGIAQMMSSKPIVCLSEWHGNNHSPICQVIEYHECTSETRLHCVSHRS